MVFKYDFLIIGAGVAGMSYALKIARAHKGKICIICKTTLDEANTAFAQGGVASVTNLKVDNFEKHIEDTMIAGDYISDRKAVEQVVRNAPAQIAELVKWGVNFDKKENGEFDLHREGGHSEFRILHHADDTEPRYREADGGCEEHAGDRNKGKSLCGRDYNATPYGHRGDKTHTRH